jgi:hypothetical protein
VKLSLLLVAILVAILIVPVLSVSAIDDPVGVNSSLFYIDTKEGGEAVINLTIENKTSGEIEVKISSWWNYTHPDADEEWIDPLWVTAIIPQVQVLPVKGQMISNIQFTVPADAAEVRYKTWIRVAVNGWEKPITVVIRKGKAIAVIDFAVSPFFHRMSVTGYPGYIDMTTIEAGDLQPIIWVRNKSSISLAAYATAESPDKDIEITQDSSITHTAEEVGTIYKVVPTAQSQEWFQTQYTLESPLPVKGYDTGLLYWSLSVPDEVVDGHYAMGVRVQLTESSSMLVKDYVVWLLLDVEREQVGGTNLLLILTTSLSTLLVIGSIIFLMTRSRLRNKPETKQTERTRTIE